MHDLLIITVCVHKLNLVKENHFFYWLPLPTGCSCCTSSKGEFESKLINHTTPIILYACDRVCHLLEDNGRQIAKYLSNEIATRVHTATDTEEAAKYEGNKYVKAFSLYS